MTSNELNPDVDDDVLSRFTVQCIKTYDVHRDIFFYNMTLYEHGVKRREQEFGLPGKEVIKDEKTKLHGLKMLMIKNYLKSPYSGPNEYPMNEVFNL